MEKYTFFNDVDDDRIYFAEDFARHLATYFTNGIFNNSCKVLGNNNDMSVNVEIGKANINGYRYDNDAIKILTIDNADGILNRIDNIVIRLDLTNRNITSQVIKGFAENPVAPNLVRTSTIYDLRLAKIYIPAGTTEITQDLITDTRFITSDCGNVISAVETPDTEDLFIQITEIFNKALSEMTTDFETWFENIKNQLDGDIAGNLQNQVNEIVSNIQLINTDVDSIEENVEKLNNTTDEISENLCDEYNNTKTYKVGDYCIYENRLYKCNIDIATAENFDVSKWETCKITNELKSSLYWTYVADNVAGVKYASGSWREAFTPIKTENLEPGIYLAIVGHSGRPNTNTAGIITLNPTLNNNAIGNTRRQSVYATGSNVVVSTTLPFIFKVEKGGSQTIGMQVYTTTEWFNSYASTIEIVKIR